MHDTPQLSWPQFTGRVISHLANATLLPSWPSRLPQHLLHFARLPIAAWPLVRLRWPGLSALPPQSLLFSLLCDREPAATLAIDPDSPSPRVGTVLAWPVKPGSHSIPLQILFLLVASNAATDCDLDLQLATSDISLADRLIASRCWSRCDAPLPAVPQPCAAAARSRAQTAPPKPAITLRTAML